MKKYFLVLFLVFGCLGFVKVTSAKVCICPRAPDDKDICIEVNQANISNCSDYCKFYGVVGFDITKSAENCNQVGGIIKKTIPALPADLVVDSEPTTCMCDSNKCVGRLQGRNCQDMSSFLNLNCASQVCSVNFQVSGGYLVPAGSGGSYNPSISSSEKTEDTAATDAPREIDCLCAGVVKKVTATACPTGCNEVVTLTNPLGEGKTDIPTIIGTLIKGAMGVMGALVLLMFVWGGFNWLTSAGNPEKVKKGTQTIIWAAIGAVLAISSYVILNTILGLFAGNVK